MYDDNVADRVIRFVKMLRHTRGKWAGVPFNLTRWQEDDILRPLFGTVREDGLRQYRTAYISMGRKGGKSELAAVIALYMLFGDNEPGAEVYSAAADRDQASIVFNTAAAMVRQSRGLLKRCKIIDSQKRIVIPGTNSFWRVLSAEAYCLHPDTLVDMADGRRLRAEEVAAGDQVVAWDGRHLCYARVNSVERQPASYLYTIETQRGRRIRVTAEHPFWAQVRGRRQQDQTHRYEWRQAKDLRVGDRLKIALDWPQRVSRRHHSEAWAMGAWVGDGECGRFRFINNDPEIVDRLRHFIETLGCTLASRHSTRQLQRGDGDGFPQEHHIIGHGKRRRNRGREWVREHFGQSARSHTKDVPLWVWQGGQQVWAAFLAGWLDTDGCVPASAHAVFWSSVSPKLLESGRALLARLGVNACVRDDRLSVSGCAQLQRLYECLGPHLALSRKREALGIWAASSPAFSYRAHTTDYIKSIRVGELAEETVSLDVDGVDTHITDGFITHNTKHGLNPHCVIFDELHAQPNRDLWDVLTTGFGARTQPLLVAITTAGYDRNSICYEQYDYAKRILAQEISDPAYFAAIYEVPAECEDWRDERVWRAANPALGDFRSLDELRQMAARTENVPALQNTFRRLYLNQWVAQSERWLDMEAWDASAGTVNVEELAGCECYGGLDLASTTDIAALSLVFPGVEDGDPARILMHYWIPADQMQERVNRDRVPYDVWVREGRMTATEGNVIDYAAIRKHILEASEKYNIKELAFDRWGAIQLVQELEGEGLTMVPMGQGFASMSSPTKEFLTRILSKTLWHGGDPVLRWMAGNVQVKQSPEGNLKPDKGASTEKIDGIVAAIMGLDRVIRHEQTPPSVYEERDLIVL